MDDPRRDEEPAEPRKPEEDAGAPLSEHAAAEAASPERALPPADTTAETAEPSASGAEAEAEEPDATAALGIERPVEPALEPTATAPPPPSALPSTESVEPEGAEDALAAPMEGEAWPVEAAEPPADLAEPRETEALEPEPQPTEPGGSAAPLPEAEPMAPPAEVTADGGAAGAATAEPAAPHVPASAAEAPQTAEAAPEATAAEAAMARMEPEAPPPDTLPAEAEAPTPTPLEPEALRVEPAEEPAQAPRDAMPAEDALSAATVGPEAPQPLPEAVSFEDAAPQPLPPAVDADRGEAGAEAPEALSDAIPTEIGAPPALPFEVEFAARPIEATGEAPVEPVQVADRSEIGAGAPELPAGASPAEAEPAYVPPLAAAGALAASAPPLDAAPVYRLEDRSPARPSREALAREALEKALPYLRFAVRAAAAVVLGYAIIVVTLIVLYRWIDPPVSTLMLGQRLTGAAIERRWVPIGRISRHLVKAVVLSEDGAFCRHRGVDWGALREAIEDDRGGSTITMQVVKNLFLWPSRSYVRKALEFPLAYLVELIWPKRRILEIYLNIAEWGDGVFGAEAAAREHFGNSASRLTAGQAALLAVALPNPREREPGEPSAGTRRLAARLLTRMQLSRVDLGCLRASRSLATAPLVADPQLAL